MKRLRISIALLSASLLLIAAPIAGAGEVQVDGRTFTMPDGFTIERVAGPPLVDRPIVADFDERGRLYVADSSGSNDPVEKQLAEKPHRIVRLEDVDGDGRFDKRTVFADRMMFPEGAMWLDGSLYVAAPPSIWKLTDTDDDGVADHREEWFRGKTLTGCANDLHGPYLGPDGWIYWCKGAFAQQTHERPGRAPFVTRAAHIFRCRPDGTGIEPVMTGGMDNPVEVAFTPGGERIVTATFLQHPGGGRRDGLIHAIYGGVYGKVHDVIDEHPRTGPDVMPVMTHLGPAAPCGLARYQSDVFGAEYRDNLFATLFNLHKVTRHVMEPDGSTYKTRDEDFLVSADLDFHPTDVLEDADGSLLVPDTGGWYKLCCPTSQLVKPDVLGAIYRVRRTDAPRLDDPRGLKLAWESISAEALTDLLDDRRPSVRERSIDSLARRGGTALPALKAIIQSSSSAEARRNAVRASTRINHPSARVAVREALHDRGADVRLAAIHSASLWRDREAVRDLLLLLKGPIPHDRRAAAEALGRIGDRTAVPALLGAAAVPVDRVLEHALTYALIEIDDASGTSAGLKSPDLGTRCAALIALDQMDGGGLKPEDVTPGLASADPKLKEVTSWIVGRHPGWGGALAGFLRDRLNARDLAASDRAGLASQLARFARATTIQDLLADRLRDASTPRETVQVVLNAMAESDLKVVPGPWVAGLADLLASDDPDLVRQAVATARTLAIPKEGEGDLRPALLKVANRAEAPAELRVEALAALPGGPGEVSASLFELLTSRLVPDLPPASRSAAADVLARAKLNSEQLTSLAGPIATAGPLEVNRLLAAFESSSDAEVGRSLVSALKRSAALSALRVETLKPILARFGPSIRREAEELYVTIDANMTEQKARLEGLLASLADGDVRRGQAVFNGSKASCSSCHAIGYLGGNVGPDLTRVGEVRSGRDLLEAIVFPSASFVRSFEPVVVATKGGRVVNGLLRKDAADEVILATGANEQVRIARDEIEEMRPGSVSVMPAGLDQQLTPRELADLLAFLGACK